MLCDNMGVAGMMGWEVEGGREVQEGGNICIPTADSC